MEISEKDEADMKKMEVIIYKLAKIDPVLTEAIGDEIYKYQPFLISLILGYNVDFTDGEALDEVTKVIFAIWEFFKDQKNVRKKKLTATQFERIQNQHLFMLKYMEGEPDSEAREAVAQNDMKKIRSKALLSFVLLIFIESKPLNRMEERTKHITLIGMQVLIKCLEEIALLYQNK